MTLLFPKTGFGLKVIAHPAGEGAVIVSAPLKPSARETLIVLDPLVPARIVGTAGVAEIENGALLD